MFGLSCCSTSDMPISFYEKRNIPYALFHYLIDGVEYDDDLGKTLSIKDFYKKIHNGAMPTTSQVNVDQYINMFTPMLEKGMDIVHICLSSGISGTYNSAITARNLVEKKYPERKIYIVDSLAASTGYGLLVEMAADLRDQGLSAEEVFKWLEDNKLKVHHLVVSTDLTHLKRGGRISSASAAVGGLLKICPFINVNYEGKLIPRTKFRGIKKAFKAVVSIMEEHALNGKNYDGLCYICHSDIYDEAKELRTLVEDNFPKLQGKIEITDIGTVIGSHTGPGTIGLFFVGDKRNN